MRRHGATQPPAARARLGHRFRRKRIQIAQAQWRRAVESDVEDVAGLRSQVAERGNLILVAKSVPAITRLVEATAVVKVLSV